MEMKSQKELFYENGYLLLKNLSNVEKYQSIEVPYKEYSQDFVRGSIVEKEHQVPGSTAHYRDPQYKELYYEVKNKIEDVLESKLYTTYYYDRFYYANQCLFPHTDRPACEISVTMHLSSNINYLWPLGFTDPKTLEEKYVTMNPGDATLYLGCDIEHFRNSLKSRYNRRQQLVRKLLRKKDDTYYHQIFFHYVLESGKYSHYAGDSGLN